MKYTFRVPPMAGLSEDIQQEIEMVADGIFGIRDSLPRASTQLGLSEAQIKIFCQNTPDKKKGLELFDEFKRRRENQPAGTYYFDNFMREVLTEAGHPLDTD